MGLLVLLRQQALWHGGAELLALRKPDQALLHAHVHALLLPLTNVSLAVKSITARGFASVLLSRARTGEESADGTDAVEEA
ncbi:MAG: hypothetical protein ACKPKO_56400, partial [Candidatus Fonsibacter sp.]